MQVAINFEQAKKNAAAPELSPQLQQELYALNPLQPEYWNCLWRGLQEASRASGRAIECWQNWDELEQARRYWQRVSRSEQQNSRLIDLLEQVQPDSRVLDIGAGPGTLALPLAAKVAHVTAVEPAAGMSQVLRENIANRSLDNIEVLQKRWDDVDTTRDLQAPYDLVVVSFAFGMLDLLDAVQKIQSVASNRIIFYWHAGPQVWDVDAVSLWPLLHNKKFTPIPKANVIFNLLYAMGIYADVKVIPRSYSHAFESFEEAMAEYSERYMVLESDIQTKARLRQYLQQNLELIGGAYTSKIYNTGMQITWTVSQS